MSSVFVCKTSGQKVPGAYNKLTSPTVIQA